MKNRVLSIGTTMALAAVLALTGSGCGQVNVIEQAEQQCDLLSEVDGRAITVKFNPDNPSSEARCMIRLMPREARSSYEADVDEEPYNKQGEYTKDGYSYQWTIQCNRYGINSVTLYFIEQ